MLNVAVLAGGRSPEHQVSIRSGVQVLSHMDRARWRPWAVRIDREGRWWVPPGALEGAPPPDLVIPGSRPLRPGAALDHLIEQCDLDVVFPALHGPYGEDGSLQGMLELHDVPFVGSRTAASAVAMDKIRTRETLTAHGVPMPACHHGLFPLAAVDAREAARAIAAGIGFPCFLKIDTSGSTLGVARAESPADVEAFVNANRGAGRRFLAEAEVVGEEITVAVLGNSGSRLRVLPPVGIYPTRDDGFFTHEAKYEPGRCEEVVPARGLDAAATRSVQELARTCHEVLQCDGMSRTDMILGAEGPVVLEVNTIPGLTRESLLPKAAAAAGITFSELLDCLLEAALATRPVASATEGGR